MTSPSADELRLIVDRLEPRVCDGQIQRVTQPGPTRFLLSVYKTGHGTTTLLIDLPRGATRFHATEKKFKNPPEALTLGLRLRRVLTGSRVREISWVEGDRVIDLRIDVKDKESGTIETKRLVLELIPSHPCLFLIAGNGEIELASEGVKSPHRDLRRGARYRFPASPPRNASPKVAFARFGAHEEIDLFACLDEELEAEADRGDAERETLGRAITKELKRQYKRIGKVEADVRGLEGGEELTRLGELLKASLHEVERGVDRVSLSDWEAAADGSTKVDIPLDATLSPQENVELMFKKAKKKSRGLAVAEERLRECRQRLGDIQELSTDFEANELKLEDLAERATLLEISWDSAPKKGKKKKRQVVAPRKPYHVFTSSEGIEIWVGRGARDNDLLTFKESSGNDWWLHAQDYPGSHIIVRTQGELDEQTLIDAATLAIEYSKAASGGKQSVSYTRRKHVSKFRGAAAGKVMLKSHKTFMVRFEAKRLERLKKTRG